MDLHGINPKDVIPLTGGPTTRLFWAINHYVSTGDHIGEGVARKQGHRWVLTIIVFPDKKQDRDDMEAFRSRMGMKGLPPNRLDFCGRHGAAEMWTLTVADADVDALADALVSEPGPMGWGSGKAVIDRYEWRHE